MQLPHSELWCDAQVSAAIQLLLSTSAPCIRDLPILKKLPALPTNKDSALSMLVDVSVWATSPTAGPQNLVDADANHDTGVGLFMIIGKD